MSAADSITATVDAMEASFIDPGDQSGWPLRALPYELRNLVGRLIQTPAFSSTHVGSDQDYRIVLHAMAHRLARLSASPLESMRAASAFRVVLAAAGQLKARLGHRASFVGPYRPCPNDYEGRPRMRSPILVGGRRTPRGRRLGLRQGVRRTRRSKPHGDRASAL